MLELNKETLNITEQEYRDCPYVSYSLLKDLDTVGPSVLIGEKQFKTSTAIDFGNLLDDLLTNPEGIEDKYYLGEIDKPTGQLLELAEEVLNTFDDAVQMTNINILGIADNLQLFGSTKAIEKRIAQFDKEIFWNYLNTVTQNKGKIILDRVSYNNALELLSTFKQHPFTRDIFNNDFEKLYQLKLYKHFPDVSLKGMLDNVLIDHKAKKVYPFDIKTGELWPDNFIVNFIRNKYYLQGGLYKFLLECKVIEYNEGKLASEHYTVENFRFIYGSSKMTSYPLVWEMDENWYKAAWEGTTRFKGLKQLIEDYVWYNQNQIFDVKRNFYETNGNLILPFNYDTITE